MRVRGNITVGTIPGEILASAESLFINISGTSQAAIRRSLRRKRGAGTGRTHYRALCCKGLARGLFVEHGTARAVNEID